MLERHYLVAFIFLGTLAPVASAFAQCVYIPDCQLVWADEFDGTAVDSSKWEFMLGDGSAYGLYGWGNNEQQYYTTSNATVSGGALTITAREEWVGGRQYTSSRLRSLNRGDWTYGRFEMRAKLPVGQGMWPAFWMLPSNSPYGGWAAGGEIDIMETIGSAPDTIHGTIHYGDQFPGNVSSGGSTTLAPGAATDWHVYAVEWQEGIIRWFVDGQLYDQEQLVFDRRAFSAPFDVNFHLLLNLAVGGNWPGNPDATTVFPQEYVIDYVRVYQQNPGAVPDSIVFDDMEHGSPFTNGWFEFFGGAGGGLGANFVDLPPADGGAAALQAGWGSGGTPGYFGGFGRTSPLNITGMTHFSFWINPDAGQDYNLEINLQDDDNGDGLVTPAQDDEFQYICRVSPTGPCAISGGGWQLVEVPISSFTVDNSYLYGGNELLDTLPTGQGGNGQLVNVVIAIVSNSGADATFRTDYWLFENRSAPITAVIDIEPDVLHPHHDGRMLTLGSLPDDVIEVVVFGASTAVGDDEDLDTDLIDPVTLRFGPGLGEVAAGLPQEFNIDADSDGIDDARFRFQMSDAAFDSIACTDDSGTLVGDLTTGATFTGTGSFTSDCDAQCHN